MEYELKQLIFYMRNNKIHSAPVLSRMYVENAHDGYASTGKQKELWTPYGPSRIAYSTCHGEVTEKEAYPSKELLIASL